MFTQFNKENQKMPIKIWLDSIENIDSNCLEQAEHLANLPFVYKYPALMPDTHAGKGMPIGGVVACDNVLIPNAVGVDIGCGMAFVRTDIAIDQLIKTMTGSGNLVKVIIGNILRTVPVGTAHFKNQQQSEVLDNAKCEIDKYIADEELISEIDEGYFQIGTLGGGNHFIEIQQDEDGMACIMIHSGSRRFGNYVGQHFNSVAHALNEKWYSSVPAEYNLPFLPADSDEGIRYMNWMKLSMAFAYENRSAMLKKVKEIFTETTEKYLGVSPVYSYEINCHHNYAELENHFGKDLWVHRKGAIRAGEGELAVIPGAMGSFSYVVRGLGNSDSFMSSSHGAGRKYSRTGALQEFSVETVMNDLKEKNVTLGKRNKSDVAEECRFAYKDIETVMKNQTDLVEPVMKLLTVGVVKG